MLMSAPIVVYGQSWQAVGLGENEMLNWRWNNCSTAMGVLGKRLPACARTGEQ